MRTLLSTLLLLGAVGCTPKFNGSVQLDGRPLTITGCRSGQVYKFVGVDLHAENGVILRLNYDLSGQARAYVFPSGEPSGVEVGLCGPMNIQQQTSRINHVYNQKGSAKLSCTGAGHAIVGEIQFENCH